jgi:hypothetical protein
MKSTCTSLALLTIALGSYLCSHDVIIRRSLFASHFGVSVALYIAADSIGDW